MGTITGEKMTVKTKPTMAFVDHSFHKNTKSGDFMKELLSSHFETTRYWDESWNGGQGIDIEELNKYDYVFFQQIISPLNEIRKLRAKVIWAPMYDGTDFNYLYWKTLSFLPIKVLCFSEKIYSHCKKFGINSIRLKYFINPQEYGAYSDSTTGIVVFFWYRGGITFKDIKKIIDPRQIDKLIYKSNPDPSYEKEIFNREDMRNFKMEIIEGGYTSRKEYLELLSQANIFIAPRKKEGIGLSFLEAMAMGQCIVGNDDATMNEYINHNYNGYLFDLKHPQIIDFSEIKEIIYRSKEIALQGYLDWENDKEKIIKFITSPLIVSPLNKLFGSIFLNFSKFARSNS